ncbi:MAG: DUF4998 domain-containing protein, partial [Bacteroidales bacterium]
VSKYINALLMGICGLFVSCNDFDSNFKEFLPEKVYSSRVSDLKGEVGYERVFLTWKLPNDSRAKSILIEDSEGGVYTAPLTDQLEIKELTSESSYNFKVFTIDAFGNKSIPSSIDLKPVSEKYIERLVVSKPVISTSGNVTTFNWQYLYKHLSLKYTGDIEYVYSYEDQEVSGTESQKVKENLIVKLNDLPIGKPIKMKYKLSFNPIVGKVVINDVVYKTDSVSFVIK